MIKDWNNQVRAGHAALALKAYSASKGERGCDEDDITDLIIDLLHLKTLVSQESIDGLVEWCYSCAINDEESDEDQADIVYEEMPEGAEEELRMWERINGDLSRDLLSTPPEVPAKAEPDVSLLPKKGVEDARGEIIGHISDSSEGKAIAARVNGWDALVAERDLLKEQVKLLREALEKARESLDYVSGYLDKEDSETVVESVNGAIDTVDAALEATKEGA